jgi:hypothetical protein
MSEPRKASTTDDARLADIVEEITERLQRRQPIDLQTYVDAYPEYADRLRRLLSTLEILKDVDREPDTSEDAKTQSTSRIPSSLGDFRIIREIGRGGMGIVYEAEQSLALSPQQDIVAAGSFDGRLTLLRADNGEIIRSVAAHGGRIFDLTFTPDGKRLCSASTDNSMCVWSVSALTVNQGPLEKYPEHRALVYDVGFSSSGNTVYSSDLKGNVHIWDAKTGAPGYELHFDGATLIGLCLSPDDLHSLACRLGQRVEWPFVANGFADTAPAHYHAADRDAYHSGSRRLGNWREDHVGERRINKSPKWCPNANAQDTWRIQCSISYSQLRLCWLRSPRRQALSNRHCVVLSQVVVRSS